MRKIKTFMNNKKTKTKHMMFNLKKIYTYSVCLSFECRIKEIYKKRAQVSEALNK